MDNIWFNLLIEIGLFTLLGLLYYLYQRRKILQFEKDKGPIVVGYILQSCLVVHEATPDLELNAVIEGLDDYLHNRTPNPPLSLLKHYAQSSACPSELKDIIEEGLTELER